MKWALDRPYAEVFPACTGKRYKKVRRTDEHAPAVWPACEGHAFAEGPLGVIHTAFVYDGRLVVIRADPLFDIPQRTVVQPHDPQSAHRDEDSTKRAEQNLNAGSHAI
jgi:hypothetical protein